MLGLFKRNYMKPNWNLISVITKRFVTTTTTMCPPPPPPQHCYVIFAMTLNTSCQVEYMTWNPLFCGILDCLSIGLTYTHSTCIMWKISHNYVASFLKLSLCIMHADLIYRNNKIPSTHKMSNLHAKSTLHILWHLNLSVFSFFSHR